MCGYRHKNETTCQNGINQASVCWFFFVNQAVWLRACCDKVCDWDRVQAMTSETQSARADALAAKAEQAMLKLAKAKEKLEQTKEELKAHIEHHHSGVDDKASSSSGSGEKKAAVDASASATAAAADDVHAEKAAGGAGDGAGAAPTSPSGAVKSGSLSGLKLVGAEIAGKADLVRQAAVKEAFMHSWNGYKKYAWGTDELMPRTKAGHNWLNQGGTIIDAMSTLAVMGEVEEFKKNAEWIKSSLHFEGKGAVSFFETTIRVLGGILSAYEFSCDLYECDKGLLDKAKDIGTRLSKAFNTPSGMPYSTINLANGQGSTPGWTGGSAILAEVATIQMEFSTLSRYTGDKSFEEKSMAVFKKIQAAVNATSIHRRTAFLFAQRPGVCLLPSSSSSPTPSYPLSKHPRPCPIALLCSFPPYLRP